MLYLLIDTFFGRCWLNVGVSLDTCRATYPHLGLGKETGVRIPYILQDKQFTNILDVIVHEHKGQIPITNQVFLLLAFTNNRDGEYYRVGCDAV